jgi:hypothetical protein
MEDNAFPLSLLDVNCDLNGTARSTEGSSFEWTQVSGDISEENWTAILVSLVQDRTLFIPADVLNPGVAYKFGVKVTR